MKDAYLQEAPGDYETTEKSVVRAASKKVIDKMDGTDNERVRSKKLKKSLKDPVTSSENPSMRELNPLAGGYNVWGATGIDGDGYALEEGKFLDFCKKCRKKRVKGKVHNCLSQRLVLDNDQDESGDSDGGGE
ncbi:hypothetical protein OAL32_00315 [Synechococcus sp. AH-551-G15]|nr:hypothetical protein [Synechococcus sp. AH-551-G15]